ncbi:MAG: hypothetical protein Fur0028_06120 [Bacteroidales bacterium]
MIKVVQYIAFLFVIFWIIKKWKFFHHPDISYKWTLFLFISKVLASFFLFFIYTEFYQNNRLDNDIFKYYDDSQLMYQAIYDSPTNYIRMLTGIGDSNTEIIEQYYKNMNFWIKPIDYEIVNENKTIIRLNAFFSLFTLQNYFINTLLFVFLSFIGLFALFKVLANYFSQNKLMLVLFVFLMPSTIFWSSAILKESLVFFSLGLLIYFFDKLLKSFSISNILFFILFSITLSFSKMYIFILIIPGLISLILIKVLSKIKPWLIILSIHLLIILLYFNSEYFLPYNFSEITVAKQHDFINMIHHFNVPVGSKIEIPLLSDSVVSFIKYSPNALINSLFRPFLFEAHNLTSLMAAIENTFILFLIILIPVFFKKNKFNQWMWFSLSFSVMLFILIGLTTPVLGALVRYKVPAFPFLLFLLINFIDFEKIHTKIKSIWKKQC